MNSRATSEQHAKLALISVCLMCVVWTGVTGNTISLYANPMVQELGISRTQFMFGTSTITGITNGLISIFLFGRIYQKFGIKKMMLAGGVIGALGFLSLALARNYVMVLLGGIGFGAGCSMNFSNTLAVVINGWYKKKQGTYMSTAQTAGSVAGIICATVWSFLIANLGWRIPLFLTVAIALANVVITYFLFKGEPHELGEQPMFAEDTGDAEKSAEPAAEEDGISYSDALKHPKYWALIVVYILVGIISYGPFSNLVLIMTDFGYEKLVGTFMSVALLASAVSLIPCGNIIDKMGSKWMVAIALGLVAVSMIIFRTGMVSLPMAYVISVMMGIGYNACLLPGSISVREQLGTKDYAQKVAIIGAASLIGIATGPSIMSLFYDLGGSYDLGYLVVTVAAIAVILLMFPLTRRVEQA